MVKKLFKFNFTGANNVYQLRIMIYQAVRVLTDELNNHLKTFGGAKSLPADFTQLRNVAHLTTDEIHNLNNVLVTLVTVSDDIPVRNLPDNVRGSINNRTTPRYLSLYVLFSSCVFSSYDESLINLSRIISFFEKNSVFTRERSEEADNSIGGFMLTVESYSPGFEESNNMWTTMGGKQFPHMLYRVRLAELAQPANTEAHGIIKQFELRGRMS
jgi:hypothetical protein